MGSYGGVLKIVKGLVNFKVVLGELKWLMVFVLICLYD